MEDGAAGGVSDLFRDAQRPNSHEIIRFFPADGPEPLWLLGQMRLPGRAPLTTFVVMGATTTYGPLRACSRTWPRCRHEPAL